MADPKGFLKNGREVADRRPVEERVQDWNEVYPGGGPGPAADHHRPGRPLHGLRHPVLPPGLPAGQHHPGVERPGLAQRLGRGDRAAARHQQLPGVHRAAVPGAVRDRLRARHQPGPGDHQERRGRDHRQGLGERVRAAAAARVAVRADRRRRRLRSGRPGRRPAAHPGRPHGGRLRAGRARSAGCCATASPSSRWRRAPRPPARPDEARGHRLPLRRRRSARRSPRSQLASATTPSVLAIGSTDAARPAGARPGARRHPPGDGVPAAGQPGLARGAGRGPDHGRGQERGHHRRRRHRRRLPRHVDPAGRRSRSPSWRSCPSRPRSGRPTSRGRRTR